MAPRKRSSMGKLAHKAALETDKALEDNELEVLRQTTIAWDNLRPNITDTETFDRLRKAVEESTRKNENIVQFKQRLENLGKEGFSAAKKIIGLLT